MNEIKKPFQPIITGRPSPAQRPATGKPAGLPAAGSSFGELLQRTLEQQVGETRQLTFSKHAQARSAERGIQLSDVELEKLSNAVGRADDKGVTDTLVLMNNTAYIVNVPNKVVVTVVDGSEAEDNIFTNIDGAVIV